MTSKLSPNAFADKLSDDLAQLAREEGFDLSVPENAGYAFARWLADLFMQADVGLEDSLDDVVLRGSSDLGIDVVLQDDTNRHLVLVQTKNRGTGRKSKLADIDAARAFLTRHEQLLSADHVRTGSEQAQELLSSYEERARAGWKTRFYYVTTGRASDELKAEFTIKTETLQQSQFDVEYALLDRSALADLHNTVSSLDASIPEHIEIDLPARTFFSKSDPYPCLIAILKGNSLRNEYLRHGAKESLFAWNIRNYLGDRGINKAIRHTAEAEPGHFFYFNNGITAVCRSFSLDANKLHIEKFQIINGAQTVASIARAKANDSVEVLFRLIKTGKVDTESGINREIIRANNTQNAIKLSDFRANDDIQRSLREAIDCYKPGPVLGKLTYQPKRTSKRGRGRVIKLEELAKIRYSYLHEPLLVHQEPKALWTPKSDGGQYEVAFGIDDEFPNSWSNRALEESLLGVAFHDEAVIAATEERKHDPKSAFLKRLRFHTVALCGIYMRLSADALSAHTLLGDDQKFRATWNVIWTEARKILHTAHRQFVRNSEKPITLFTFVRNDRAWAAIVDDFRIYLRLPLPPSSRAT